MSDDSSYGDIVSWAENAYPSANYERFSDWLKDIINDFSSSGHYFPEEVIELLKEHWLEEYGMLELEEITEEQEESELEEQEAIEEQVKELPSKEETKQATKLREQIRQAKKKANLPKRKSKGKRSRARRKRT